MGLIFQARDQAHDVPVLLMVLRMRAVTALGGLVAEVGGTRARKARRTSVHSGRRRRRHGSVVGSQPRGLGTSTNDGRRRLSVRWICEAQINLASISHAIDCYMVY